MAGSVYTRLHRHRPGWEDTDSEALYVIMCLSIGHTTGNGETPPDIPISAL